MSRDWRLRLDDIVAYADDALAYVRGLTYDQFAADPEKQRAILYTLLVVGEASKYVPDEVRARAPAADWRGASGFRDFAAHGYHAIALPRVWRVLTTALPQFRAEVVLLRAALDAERGGG